MMKSTPYEIVGLFNKSFARVASLDKGISGILLMNPAVFLEEDFVAVDEDQNQVNEQVSSAAVAQSQRSVSQQLSTGNSDLLPSTSSGIQQKLETRLEPAFANPATTSSTTNDIQEQSLYPDPYQTKQNNSQTFCRQLVLITVMPKHLPVP
ncbi:hypothetical protein HHI36_008117 [Cryptolaemus montrouzieri]|uniref:Uncharacterized protein n=1 Tax=Cryptolaemus montrouzieri TaxID=559131 RepID=A0ABD2MRH2_9CUCU